MKPDFTREQVQKMIDELLSPTAQADFLAQRVKLWLPALPFLSTRIHNSDLNGVIVKGAKNSPEPELWITADGRFCEFDASGKPAFWSVALVVSRYDVIKVINAVEAKLHEATRRRLKRKGRATHDEAAGAAG